jgi:hypothetical protein
MSCGNKNLYIPRRLLRKFYFSLNFISNRKKEKKKNFFCFVFPSRERERILFDDEIRVETVQWRLGGVGWWWRGFGF